MELELRVVESKEELRQGIVTFNQEAKHNPDRTRKILSQTWYWIWDADSSTFGPSKFVGYRGMNFVRYEAANQQGSVDPVFDGGVTHLGDSNLANSRRHSLASMARHIWSLTILDGWVTVVQTTRVGWPASALRVIEEFTTDGMEPRLTTR
jgi:hypothetical protein